MEIENSKKPIGWGLIILFSVFIINNLFNAVLHFTWDSSIAVICNRWWLLSQIIQAAIVIFVAFNRKSQALIFSKIGACLYSTVMLIYIINNLSGTFTGEFYLHFAGAEYLYTFLLYTPGLLLLVWGLPKLWLPVKLATTLMVAISSVGMIIPWIYYSLSTILIIINIIVTIAALILTIVWFNRKQKSPSAQQHSINLI